MHIFYVQYIKFVGRFKAENNMRCGDSKDEKGRRS
jgi:hypothetical protein